MTQARMLLLALGLAVIVVGWLLVPRSAEQAAMMLRDGRIEEARQILVQAYWSGDRRPNIIVELAHIHQIEGDTDAAARLLAEYLEHHGHDTRTLAELLKLRRWQSDTAAQQALLEQMLASNPTQAHLAALLAIYRQRGEFDAELRQLQSLASKGAADKQPLSLDHTLRLAELLIAKGDGPAAASLLAEADERAPDTWVKPRLYLFSLLVEQEHLSQARERALKWIATWSQDWRLLDLVKRSATLAPQAFTLDLVAAIASRHPATQFPIIGTLATEGHRPLAIAALRNWAKSSAQADNRTFNQFLYASRSLGDAAGLFSALVGLARTDGAQAETARFAELLAASYGLTALTPVRDILTPAVLAARPLFAAELAVHEQNLFLARHYLDAVQLAKLSPREQIRWLELTRSVVGPATAFAHLDAMRRADRLPRGLLGSFATLALDVGRPREHDAALAAAAGTSGLMR